MKSRLPLICVVMIIISYPLYNYHSQEIFDRRAKAQHERREKMAQASEKSNAVIDEDNMKTYYVLSADSLVVSGE
ncbi:MULTISPECIES: hypothetical protein [unclassified Dysgonomonas]|uniref:hypothetical protein n=1 Tax=unclassified Dysgonomonas TaxID=2630389 RepID=UPI0013EAE8DE|nr:MULTISPECIES: hypothetical protein [unclassified Dysgonomonas]